MQLYLRGSARSSDPSDQFVVVLDLTSSLLFYRTHRILYINREKIRYSKRIERRLPLMDIGDCVADQRSNPAAAAPPIGLSHSSASNASRLLRKGIERHLYCIYLSLIQYRSVSLLITPQSATGAVGGSPRRYNAADSQFPQTAHKQYTPRYTFSLPAYVVVVAPSALSFIAKPRIMTFS